LRQGSPVLRLAAVFSLLAPTLTAGAVLAAMFTGPAYQPLSRSLSVLGEHGAPLSLAVNISFAALGLSVLALGLALDRVIMSGGRGGVWLLLVAGASLVGVALVARDPTQPPLLALHRLLALVAFCSLALAPLLLVRRLRADVTWRAHATPSLGFGVAALALLFTGGALFAAGQLRAGIWEVVFSALSLVWLTLTAARLTHGAWRTLPPGAGPELAAGQRSGGARTSGPGASPPGQDER
jgi:hypothetical membrane protein